MLEYEFEEVSCGRGLRVFLRETAAHREVIVRRAADGWRYVGCIPKASAGLTALSRASTWYSSASGLRPDRRRQKHGQKQIDRINELARKAKTPEGLTEWGRMEQAALRQEYIDSVLGNLKSQLDHTYVVDDQGNKRKLKQKED